VISSITYAEYTFGAINKKASPKMPSIVDEFVNRLDEIKLTTIKLEVGL